MEPNRSVHFLNIISEVFDTGVGENNFKNLEENQSFDRFLNDISCSLLCISASNGSFRFSNQIPLEESESHHRKVVFLKRRQLIITPENVKSAVFMFTIDGSPMASFYHVLKLFYIPVLLGGQIGREPEVQKTLKTLESRLRHILNERSDESDYSVITNVIEEINYWQNLMETGNNRTEREQAEKFFAVLKNAQNDFSNMNSGMPIDLEEVIDGTVSILDELWKVNSHSYSKKRMQKLMDIIGNSIVFYFQERLGKMNIWSETFNNVIEIIDNGISACEKWNKSIYQLCTVDWSDSSERSWSGNPPVHDLCSVFSKRLTEIKDIRSGHRQLTRLLSASEQKEMETNVSFSYFKGLKPVICSPYTESQWKSAMDLFQKSLIPAENRVSIKLRNQLRHLKANTLQLLQELKRYRELIKRPNISSYLVAERENLLSLLRQYLDSINIHDGPNNAVLDMPKVVERIYWARQLRSKIEDIKNVSGELLSDLSGFNGLDEACTLLLDQLKSLESEEFDEWVREVNRGIVNKELTLSGDSRVLRLTEGKMTEVNYNPRLARLIREVQQLSAISMHIPAKIRELSDRAMKFVNQARSLEQIANFHNTVGDRIIPSQKPMLLLTAQELDKLINLQQGVTWSDVEAVDKYIERLQRVVERLSKESNKLAFYHNQIREKVLRLMDSDILRHNNAWKQGLRDIKEIISHVENLKFPHMESWKLHWDYQLYKALERQYQLGLCHLHSHFPEFKVELIYRQQRLKFQPPMEEIRMKYYTQVRKFLSLPLSFRGISEGTTSLFATIIPRNAGRFSSVFTEAENLFKDLEKLRKKWYKWVSLGGINLDALIKENLRDADDWDWNFRASKNLAQETAKLQYNDEKIGCIHVSVLPIRGEMEIHNRRYWDTLVTSLQTSILRDINDIEKYISEGIQDLNSRPRTLSEIGEAHVKHSKLLESSVEMMKALESMVKKNKTLANWTKEKIEQVNGVLSQWDNFQSSLANYQSIIGRQVEGMKATLIGETENLKSEVEKFGIRWHQLRPKDTDIQDSSPEVLKKVLGLIKAKNEEWNGLKMRKEKLLADYLQFDLKAPDLSQFEKIEEDLNNCGVIWTFYEAFHSDLDNLSKEEWLFFRNKLYKLDEFLNNWEKKIEEKETTMVTVKMLQEINSYKLLLPLLKYVRGELFSEKHWLEMFSILQMENKPPESLTLGAFLSVKENIIDSDQRLQELNMRAASEISIRQALSELDAWEVQARFTLIQHTDSKDRVLMILKDFADVLNKIGDNQCLLQSVLNSPNSKNFVDRTAMWETKLANLEECIRNLNVVQRKWVYLEPIFGNGTFAREQGRFERIDQDFRYIMAEICKDNHVIALTRIMNLKQTLNLLVDQLGRCQNSLNEYLQEKRSSFPRFYFLGDDDLLELLGQSTKERIIQAHLKKIFSGINSVIMNDGLITSFKSLHGEVVQLLAPVKTTTNIEDWLSDLNKEMTKTLKSLVIQYTVKDASGDKDPEKFPSQVLCLGESIWFTKKCEEQIPNGRLQEFHKILKEKLQSYTKAASEWLKEDTVLELKLKALILDTIHHIHILETLMEHNVTSVNDWHWQKQLRYYMTQEGTILVRMLDAEMQYSYEYQGNNQKLVRTELTEKCFLTLTQSIRMGLGGNPFGPAGTGKTESVKALGALLGRQVLVFNCDEGIDVKSMARIFVGLVKCGAWGCFDEFNRLEETTLSAVSMLIQPIQASLRGNKKTVKILDDEIEINLNCGIFVTLNPAGKDYGGRQKLPDNLKQLFRPVIMSVPDKEHIARVGLYSEGFQNAEIIGRKLVEVFDLAQNLLSKRQHYDWGLRALKTILGSCGNLFKKSRIKETSEISEMEIAVQTLRFNTLSKLTFADSLLFDNIVRDVFPGVKFVNFEFQELAQALKTSANELGLQVSEHQIKKCIELYEQMQQRMGVTLVGPSGAGKTTIIQLLKHGLEKIGKNVKYYVMNPKSMPRTQLLGHIDLDTRQWTEGVLTSTAMKLHSESTDVWSWLICDGDIDPDWVEALNSVLDDNRLLTLPSGWRIQFGPNVNFLFETCDLTHASPATVSRMGIIFLSDESVDISLTINSWLKSQDEESRQFLEPYISDYFFKSIEWIKKNGELVVPFSIIGLVNNGLSLLVGVKRKPHFAIALVHGLGGNLTYDTRKLFAKYVFDSMGEFIPEPSKILDSYYNEKRDRIDVLVLEERNYDLKEEFPPIFTPAMQTSIAILKPWMNSYEPVLVTGPEGCGKNLLLKYCLSKQPATDTAVIHCNSLISPEHVLLKLKQLCVAISGPNGRLLRPKNSQKLVLYFKNLELAAPDKWRTNMLVAWLQQVLGYNGFYDTDLEWTNLDRVQIVATLNDCGFVPSERLTSRMRIYYLNPPDESDLKVIYSYYVKSIIENNFGRYKALTAPSKISSLVSTLLLTYQEVRKNFPPTAHKTYSFTPRYLTRWCSGLKRYTIDAGNPVKSLLTAVAYEALRLFHDRLTKEEDRSKMKNILAHVMQNEWNHGEVVENANSMYYVVNDDRKCLSALDFKDWTEIVKKGVAMSLELANMNHLLLPTRIDAKSLQTSNTKVSKGDHTLKARLNSVESNFPMTLSSDNDIFVTNELLRLTACIDRSLSVPEVSLTLCGLSGSGRKTALRIVSALHGARFIVLNMFHEYNLKNFKIDLKAAFQAAGVEGESVYLVIEGYQILNNMFMSMINSLICSREVPGLYTPEELESVISQLKDLSSQDGFSGSNSTYFAERVLKNLHIVLILDFNETYFPVLCENNPGIYSKCEVIWTTDWSLSTMKVVPRIYFSRLEESVDLMSEGSWSEVSGILADIHSAFKDRSATPRRYVSFLQSYIRLYCRKRKANLDRVNGLKAGVQKITEARSVVDSLKRDANKQEEKLAEKRAKAASALDLIGDTMKNANIHKGKMEKLKEVTASENKTLMERKKAIDKELAEVEPLIGEARQAVGNIKNESLSEIRSLRAPPDIIRDILEGVLRLMGIQDTSWNSMKNFLAKRGVKEEIRTFDANRISPENREAVESLLAERRDSFDPKVAKRASVAAAPLAAWVKANITYAKVLEKIRPLEREQINLEQNLKDTEAQMGKLSVGLGEVDKKVAELKEQLNTYTRDAAIIEINLAKAQETMASAEELVLKLDDEYNRWKSQLSDLSEELKDLPRKVLLASAFISYLSSASEEERAAKLSAWRENLGLSSFSITEFLSSDREKLKWQSEGLSSDHLSLENAVTILETDLSPLLIDPNGIGLDWLKTHFSESNLEITSQSNSRFQTILELAIRFGKVLIIEEVNEVSPVLMPILRKSIVNQGPRQVIYVGDKVIDYHKDFKLFLVTRNTDFDMPADVLAISFLTTQKGLARQLLTSAVQQERPELELRRGEIMKEQEEMKSKLFILQERLLKELASAQGDILQNKDLLNSLNDTKANSEDISKALSESRNLQLEVDRECEAFKPISEFASRLYFTISCLSKLSVMNQYSVCSFGKIFEKSLKNSAGASFEDQKRTLIKLVYNYVTRSLFKADRLTFALHLIHETFADIIQTKEWDVFTGEAVTDFKSGAGGRDSLPNWVEEDRAFDLQVLRNSLPQLFQALELSQSEEWINFARSGRCEKEIPKKLSEHLSLFQQLLIIQAIRPDRLLSTMTEFCLKVLHLDSLSPLSMRLSQVFEESLKSEPILIIVSPGADPSEELRLLSKTTLGTDLHEVALGQGQISVALEELRSCGEAGEWLCLKNLHLMTSWLKELVKELRILKLHDKFRLWLTTEPHENFSPVLANSCLKVVYEAPAGIKKNLQRTYGLWTAEMFRRKGVLFGRTMFSAAWLHAVVQERRNYIPQGWTKFYEITDSDLHAASDLVSRVFRSGIVNWEFIHGVLLHTIYGGRVENDFDIQALGAYIREYFNENTLNKGRGFGPNLNLPSSESYPEYLELIHRLSDIDIPSYFGLPENIERSWQKIRSYQTIDKIKSNKFVLHQPRKNGSVDVKSWQKYLSPILNLWKKLNDGAGLIEIKQSQLNTTSSKDPVVEFFHKDFRCGLRAVQYVHKTLATISKVIRGIILPGQEIIKIAESLLWSQTPSEWQNHWEGPENPLKYIRSVVYKTLKGQKLLKLESSEAVLNHEIDLFDFLQPEMFIKATKQLTGRKMKIPLDELCLACDWKNPLKRSSVSFRLKNLQLEGALFNGRNFEHTDMGSPSVTTAPVVHVGFVEKGDESVRSLKEVKFPVYRTSDRDKVILILTVPCEGSFEEWLKAGPAFFLRETDA